MNMNLSDELQWRGYVNQTTFQDLSVLDGKPLTFYLGVDPSADSMTVGNLAIMMLVKTLAKRGHKTVMLVGGATGMIGDPDGKKQERDLLTLEDIARNKAAVSAQYKTILEDLPFETVDNYDWFKDMNYLDFLRDVGKHVPMRQMLGRDFVQSRLDSTGISYAEFSYALIQGYDFVHLYDKHGVTLQVCGADQWGNCIAGVELVRRMRGGQANVLSIPLVVNKTTGVKFGKSEAGAVWLDPSKTSPTAFYQFWINLDDAGLEEYLKIYTELSRSEIESILTEHSANPRLRHGQTRLATEVTRLIHGQADVDFAQEVTSFLTGAQTIDKASPEALAEIAKQLPGAVSTGSIIDALVDSGLASSKSEARRFLDGGSISINGAKITGRDTFTDQDFLNGHLLLRRGKAYKDSALISLRTD
jgi:tyrosyl-tRNA synthetase